MKKIKFTDKEKIEILVKASGKGVREISIENGSGFSRIHKIHKSKKKYNRKSKHKKSYV